MFIIVFWFVQYSRLADHSIKVKVPLWTLGSAALCQFLLGSWQSWVEGWLRSEEIVSLFEIRERNSARKRLHLSVQKQLLSLKESIQTLSLSLLVLLFLLSSILPFLWELLVSQIFQFKRDLQNQSLNRKETTSKSSLGNLWVKKAVLRVLLASDGGSDKNSNKD